MKFYLIWSMYNDKNDIIGPVDTGDNTFNFMLILLLFGSGMPFIIVNRKKEFF